MADRVTLSLPAETARPLRRALWVTLAGLWVERLLQAFWPLGSMALAGFAVWALVPLSFPQPVIWAAAALALGLAALGLWRFRLPRRAEATRRIDASLPGRPLAALADRQVLGQDDAASAALWAAHQARALDRLRALRPVGPAPDLAPRDPYGLRLMAVTLALVALIFGTPGQRAGLAPTPAAAVAMATWEGWITPPPYTGRPGLYLNDITRDAFEVPQGSVAVIRFYGPEGALRLDQRLGPDTGPGSGPGSGGGFGGAQFTIVSGGRLSIDGPGGRTWAVTVLPDLVPVVERTGVMERGQGGAIRQGFRLRDDYGVTQGWAEIVLDLDAVDRRHGLALPPEPREALVLDLPLPVTGRRDDVTGTMAERLPDHPWAHLPVRVVLAARDAAAQEGRTDPEAAILPGRRFFEPNAAAVAELRRDILWNRDNARRGALLLRAMLHRSDGVFRSDIAPMALRGAVAFIEDRSGALDDTARDELAAILWDIALTLEEGELADARERLQRARDRLDEAMRNGASPDEIAELMDELRAATRDYMRMLAEQAEDPEPGDQRDQGNEDGQRITQDQIQELMDQIQALMEQGRMEEAAELMAFLNDLLDNLQMQRGAGGEPMPGQQSLEDMGDTLGEQQQLADETFRELQDEFRDGGDEGRMGDLAQRQQALRDRLRDQQLRDLPGAGTEEGDAALDAFEEAQRAMEEAAQALDDGDAFGALDAQAEAMEALREGMRRLNEAMTQDRREGRNEGQAQSGTQQAGRDPLGRPRDGDSARGSDIGTDVPGLSPQARARELMDEIGRRAAERERAQAELDYLDRLIERF